MISKPFFSLIFIIIVQYVFSAENLETSDSKPNSEIIPISLSEILSTFRREHHDAVDIHLGFMLLVASYGDHMYELPVNLSPECWKTARATCLMLEKLATCEETFGVVGQAANNVTRYLQKQTELQEHPLELVCRQLEMRFAADSSLKPLFEKARKDVENSTKVNNHPAYFHKLIKGQELELKLMEKMDVPEIAKNVALSTFVNLERHFYYGEPMRPTIFAKACREVAKKEAFAESMQKIFEKTIDDMLPLLMAKDRVEKYISALKSRKYTYETYWRVRVPSMVKIFYDYVAKDPILKKEVDDAAAIIGGNQYASKDDLDFSKF